MAQQKGATRRRQGERRPREPVSRARVIDHFGDRVGDAPKYPPLAPFTDIQVGEADLGDQDVVPTPDPRHFADRPAQRQRADDVAGLQPAMEPNKVEFLVRQYIRCQIADVIGRRIDENLLPRSGVRGKPRNMPARAHHEPSRLDVDGSAGQLPASITRVNDDAPGLSSRHHRLGELAVGRDVDCYPVAL